MIQKKHIVKLDSDHPGFKDLNYRNRRDFIALESEKFSGTPESIPIINYEKEEHDIWQLVYQKLNDIGQKYASERHIEGIKKLKIPKKEIPQLRNISKEMINHTGFQMAPVMGLVTSRDFLGCIDKKIFCSTQYIRHKSQPGFTPEPDIIHDVLGHSGGLCDDLITKIAGELGNASKFANDNQILDLENLYWFTIEYGLCLENKKIKAFGAGNLSSYMDLERCIENKEIHNRFEVEIVAKTKYDPTIIQEKLFVIDSFEDCYTQIKQYCNGLK